MMARRKSTVPNKEIFYVHGIVDAAVQLVFRTEVINADYECFYSQQTIRLVGVQRTLLAGHLDLILLMKL